MVKYKILVIAHSLKNNKIAEFGEEVEESQLTSPAKELVNAGFIEEVKAKESIEKAKVETNDLEVESEEVKAVKKPIKNK